MYRLIAACSAIAALMCACTPHEAFHHDSGSTWGTVYNIKYLSDRDLSDSIVAVMREIDMSLSPFEKASLVSAVNSGAKVRADSMLMEVIDLSKYVCTVSGGAFDPTVAPLVNLWGFGYKDAASDRPDSARVAEALASVGIMECGVDSDGYVVRKSPDTEFNFSAVAKGYGVDRIARMLRRNGVSDYMVEVGGEIALSGDGPSGKGWRIQVDAPTPEDGMVRHDRLTVLSVTDICVATSGNYRNHHATSDGEVGHTISPVTGYPVATATLSATVLAPTTALADALATAVMAMPPDSAMSMIERQEGVEAMLVTAAPSGGYDMVATSGFFGAER